MFNSSNTITRDNNIFKIFSQFNLEAQNIKDNYTDICKIYNNSPTEVLALIAKKKELLKLFQKVGINNPLELHFAIIQFIEYKIIEKKLMYPRSVNVNNRLLPNDLLPNNRLLPYAEKYFLTNQNTNNEHSDSFVILCREALKKINFNDSKKLKFFCLDYYKLFKYNYNRKFTKAKAIEEQFSFYKENNNKNYYINSDIGIDKFNERIGFYKEQTKDFNIQNVDYFNKLRKKYEPFTIPVNTEIINTKNEDKKTLKIICNDLKQIYIEFYNEKIKKIIPLNLLINFTERKSIEEMLNILEDYFLHFFIKSIIDLDFDLENSLKLLVGKYEKKFLNIDKILFKNIGFEAVIISNSFEYFLNLIIYIIHYKNKYHGYFNIYDNDHIDIQYNHNLEVKDYFHIRDEVYIKYFLKNQNYINDEKPYIEKDTLKLKENIGNPYIKHTNSAEPYIEINTSRFILYNIIFWEFLNLKEYNKFKDAKEIMYIIDIYIECFEIYFYKYFYENKNMIDNDIKNMKDKKNISDYLNRLFKDQFLFTLSKIRTLYEREYLSQKYDKFDEKYSDNLKDYGYPELYIFSLTNTYINSILDSKIRKTQKLHKISLGALLKQKI